MNLAEKQFLNNFVNLKNDDNEFNLVLNKLDDFLSSFFEEITLKVPNIFFKTNLIGEHAIYSNYDLSSPIHIMIEYFAQSEDLSFSEKRNKKGEIGRLMQDAFNTNKNLLPTIEELSFSLYKKLNLNSNEFKVFLRKNQIAVKIFDYNFFIFFVNKNQLEKETKFTIKSKDYEINFDLTHKNLLQKNLDTKEKFFELVKFYKVIEKELILINKLKINASKILYFYENLLYNVPNELLENEYVFDNFLNSFAYLNNQNIEDLIDSCGNVLVFDNYKLFAKYSITTDDIKKVLKQTNDFINNLDTILHKN